MRILAHRGASGYAPENTYAAFDLACRMAVDALETDIRLTRDGVPVHIHDERVDRTTNGTGLIAEMDWKQVAELDAGSHFAATFAGERVPRLDAFLARYAKRIELCLEVKHHTAVKVVETLVREHGLGRFVGLEFTSFEWDVVVPLREAFPDISVGHLVRQADTNAAMIRRVAEAGLNMIGPPAGCLTAELVAMAEDLGLQVRTWGVKTQEQFQHVIACAAHGTTLNWPDWANGYADVMVTAR
jgi:glycerophosphoryl diester phosphodiesterase